MAPKKPKKPTYLDIAKEFKAGKSVWVLAFMHDKSERDIQHMIRRAMKENK